MHGVAAKITVEILVGLEKDDADTLPRQEQAENHTRRTSADDAAIEVDVVYRGHSQPKAPAVRSP